MLIDYCGNIQYSVHVKNVYIPESHFNVSKSQNEFQTSLFKLQAKIDFSINNNADQQFSKCKIQINISIFIQNPKTKNK